MQKQKTTGSKRIAICMILPTYVLMVYLVSINFGFIDKSVNVQPLYNGPTEPIMSLKQLAPWRVVVLLTDISPNSTPGSAVALQDADHRYFGELVREPTENRFHTSSTDGVGSDSDGWSIAIVTQMSLKNGVLTEPPAGMRVRLPRARLFSISQHFDSIERGYPSGTELLINGGRSAN